MEVFFPWDEEDEANEAGADGEDRDRSPPRDGGPPAGMFGFPVTPTDAVESRLDAIAEDVETLSETTGIPASTLVSELRERVGDPDENEE
jgi:hypothetical protein